MAVNLKDAEGLLKGDATVHGSQGAPWVGRMPW